MRHWVIRLVAMAALAMMVTGCGYSATVSRTETTWNTVTSADRTRYGQIRMALVKEYRSPRTLAWLYGRKPFYTAEYLVAYQVDGGVERQIQRINFEPVRPGDFGNFYPERLEWASPDRLTYRVSYGYLRGEKKALEGEILIPPIQ